MDREEYNHQRLLEIDTFQDLVFKQGHQFLRNILNDNWFNQIRVGGSEVWLGKVEEYDCRFFPFRWLLE